MNDFTYELPRVVKLVKTESTVMVARGWWEEGTGSC